MYLRLREQAPCENRLFQAICANQSPSVSRPNFSQDPNTAAGKRVRRGLLDRTKLMWHGPSSSGGDRVRRGSVPFWPHLDDY